MAGELDAKQAGLIWITEAMVVYQHNRDWFQERIDDERLKKVSLPGSVKVYLRQEDLKALGEEPRLMWDTYICKVPECDDLGTHCGVCGNYTCIAHGHKIESRGIGVMGTVGDTSGQDVVFESWICNDCSQNLVDTFQQHPPKPVRLGW